MFVSRDENGKIFGLWTTRQHPGQEELADDHADVLAALAPKPAATIATIERENPITHRALRELILALGELYPAAKATPFYTRAKAADDLIKVERAKL